MIRKYLISRITTSVVVCLLAVPAGQSQTADEQARTDETPALLGPGSAELVGAPLVVAAEPAQPEEGEGETGRLFRPDPLPDGPHGSAVRLLRFSAPGAAAFRLYFEQVRLPAGARMFLYGLDSAGAVTKVFGPYEDVGPLSDASFRSRIIPGIEAVLELQGMNGTEWPFHLAWVASIDATLLADLRRSNDPSLSERPEERKPPRGELRQLEIDGQLRTVEVVAGLVILEGDIVLGTEHEVFGPDNSSKEERRFSIARTESSGRWPGGVVPYRNDIRIWVEDKGWVADERVRVALDHWKEKLDGFLAFVPRTTQSDYIVFEATTDSVCQSRVGRQGGAQEIRLSSSCTAGNVRHEIGHAVGLHHEIAREDRNSYVRILWDNIQDDKKGNFEKKTGSANTDLGPYDFGSIMHYSFMAFSKNSKPTTEPVVDVPTGITVGQRTSLSLGDVNGVKAMYGISAGPAELYVYREGGSYSVNVWTQADRSWKASEDASWFSIASGSSGQGSGKIQLSIARNDGQLVAKAGVSTSLIEGILPTLAPTRTAYVYVALTPFAKSVTVKVIQAAGDCSISVLPTKLVVPRFGGTYSVNVSTPSHCDWTVAENLPWVALSPSYHGKGSMGVSVKVSANLLTIGRTGSIVIAGKTVAITQEGGECLLCM